MLISDTSFVTITAALAKLSPYRCSDSLVG